MMRDDLLNALNRRLVGAESAGLDDLAKDLRKRIKDREGEVEAEAEAAAAAAAGLDGLTKAELVDRARDAGVEGYSTMNKAELVAAVEAAETETNDGDQ